MMKNRQILYISLIAISYLLTSCVTQKYERPKVNTAELYRSSESQDTTSIAKMPWDKLFSDEKLKALVTKGLNQNANFKNAIENIAQAQASLKQSKLAYLPSLDFNTDVSRNKNSQAALNFPAGININTLTTTYRGYLSTSWEADIWGKISSRKRIALANFLETDAAKRAIQTQLIANIANTYYNLLALDEQLEITQKTLETRIKNVEIVKALKEAAILDGAAVVQSEANRYAAEVLIPDLKQSIRENENALNILMSQPPGPIDRGNLSVESVSKTLDIGISTQLLSNRPDVQQAEYNFRSAFENTNLAKTYFYPSLTVTAAGGLSTLQIQNFFDQSIFYNLIGGLTQPIFNRGENKTRLTIAKSQQIQALNSFQQALLVAGQETSDALYAFEMAQEKKIARLKQIEALEKAVDYTEQLLQYTSATNYTDVLTSQQSLLSAQLSGINDKLQELQAVVNLYRALGGGWQ